MRASTFIGLAVALILAGIAVFGMRTWMEAQRIAIVQQTAQTQNSAPKNYVVVAKVPLGFGARITADNVELLEWASDRVPPEAFTDVASVVGTGDDTARYVLSSVAQGELLLPGKLTTPGQRAKLSTALSPGMKAISIRVSDISGVAGFVLPGDRVDVMLTRSDGTQTFVDILMQGLRVIAIDQTADDRKDQPSVVRTVTFEVTTEQAQKLTLAATVGTLSLALRNVASSDVEDFDRVTVIDLNDTESALREKELADAKAAAEAARAERDAQLAAAQAALEAAKNEKDTASAEAMARLAALEAELQALRAQQAQPVAVAAPPVAEAPVVEAPVENDFTNVGVVRGGRRDEYRVLTFLGLGE
jgi:pilus assembly protein CpaB